jgi:type VI secretion system secreted protein Hcp
MPIYMKYGSINGDVTAPGYQGWIELDSFQWGATSPPTTPGAAGKVSVSDVTLTKTTDAATVNLIKELLAGTPTDNVTIAFIKLSFRKLTGAVSNEPYLQYTLDNTLITSYSLSLGVEEANTSTAQPAENLSLPSESLSLNFVQFDVHYTDQTGSRSVGFDEGTGTLTSPST